jgi:hypothetical protein
LKPSAMPDSRFDCRRKSALRSARKEKAAMMRPMKSVQINLRLSSARN